MAPFKTALNNNTQWPQDVGILAMELYFPSQYVDQTELEEFDGVSTGKYTVGLGQGKMGFCTDREDINSLCLTVVKRLMDRNNISFKSIGRLEVGTETLVDKSKSVKSVLMQLFEGSGNSDVEGVDTINACYGGTSALFNSLAWVESSAWDGRFALVVCGDIAVYASGNARCTGGAGTVAMLIGPNAPLVVERGLRTSHMCHVYDFYKPNMDSEFPVVDGKLSVECYTKAIDVCYQNYCKLADQALQNDGSKKRFSVHQFDAVLFHSPYCRLVQKSFARLFLHDFLKDPAIHSKGLETGLDEYKNMDLQIGYINPQLEKVCLQASQVLYKRKTEPTLLVANQVGNMYTASLYGGICAFLSRPVKDLLGCRIGLFSYGSGSAASMFSMRVTDKQTLALQKLSDSMADLRQRLEARTKVEPQQFDLIMKIREHAHGKAPFSPKSSIDHLFDGTWFLSSIDAQHRRKYEWKPYAEETFMSNFEELESVDNQQNMGQLY